MFKCNRCGQYYIPGFLDCRCRVAARQLHSANVSPSLGHSEHRVAGILPSEAEKSAQVAARHSKSDLLERRATSGDIAEQRGQYLKGP